MNVGDIFVSIRGDGSKLPADATKAAETAGDAAGKSFSDRFSGAARLGFTALAAGAGAVLGGLTKLALEGESAMAHFRAETGASQEEAEAALDSMNRLSAENLQSFDTVAKTLTTVRTQMGLTGAAAEAMADRILKWSTATGQDAVEATSAFDDVLDAWNLTAADTQSIMDALLFSHQKYGGTVAESESALTKLAPALTAANMGWQDAVGLINLANAAGVEAADIVPAMTRALSKVKSPEELKTLLADIGATENGFERSSKAADLFGTKSGAKLGLALAASHGDLAQFKVDVNEAAGAVDEAASAIEDTLPNKIKLAVSNALSAVRGLGTDLGPALTGSAALVSLGSSFAAALGLDKALSKAIGTAVETPAVQGAWKMAGSKLGALVGIGVVVGLAALAPDLMKLAKQLGTDLNKQIFGEHEAEGGLLAGTIFDSFGDAVHSFMAAAEDAPWPIGNKDAPDWARLGGEAGKEYGDGFADGLGAGGSWGTSGPKSPAEARATILRLFGIDDSPAATEAVASDLTDRLSHMWSRVTIAVSRNVMDHPKPSPVAQLPNQVAKEVPEAAGAISDVLRHMWSAVTPAPAKQLGVRTGEQFIVGFKSTRDEAKTEWQQYLDDLAHPGRGRKTVGWLVGKLTGEELAKGLASSDPIVRRSAEQEQQNLRIELQALLDAGYTIGKKALAKLGLGIKDGKLVALTAAETARGDIEKTLGDTSGYYQGGKNVGAAWAKGLADAIRAGVARAEDALHNYHGPMIGESPPKTGPLRHIDRGGFNIGKAWRDAFVEGIGVDPVNDALSRIGFAGAPTGGYAASAGAVTVRHRHDFGTLRIETPNLSPAAAGALGAGLGRTLGIETIVGGFDRVLTSDG